MGGAQEGGRGNRESQTIFIAEAALTRVNSSHRETPTTTRERAVHVLPHSPAPRCLPSGCWGGRFPK